MYAVSYNSDGIWNPTGKRPEEGKRKTVNAEISVIILNRNGLEGTE